MFKKLKRFFFGNNISSRVQDAEIERGSRALKTAALLVRQSAQGGFLPQGVIVDLDGTRELLTHARLAAYSATVDCYAQKVRQYANIAEQAGFTKDHPFVKAMGDFRIDIPKPEIPPIPKIDLPKALIFDYQPLPMPPIPPGDAAEAPAAQLEKFVAKAGLYKYSPELASYIQPVPRPPGHQSGA